MQPSDTPDRGHGSAFRAWEEGRFTDDDGGPGTSNVEWQLDDVREQATGAVRRGSRSGRTPQRGRRPDDGETSDTRAADGTSRIQDGDRDRSDIVKAAGPGRADRLEKRLKDASRAFRRERYGEARQILRSLVQEVPGSADVRELLGITFYRERRWRDAAKELEEFRRLTGSTEQHPVLADCYRAQRRWTKVESLWEELREASPSADLVAEGRIVTAGALADQRRYREAIALLEAGKIRGNRLAERHLRMLYALADIHERAGDVPGARALFIRIREVDPDFVDVVQRIRSLA